MTAQAGSASSLSGIDPAAGLAAFRLLLRRQMRLKRAGLAAIVRKQAALGIARQVQRERLLRPGLNVAVYLSVRGEADLEPVIERARRLGCRLYLPRVTNLRRGQMEFLRFTGRTALRRNALGLKEPPATATRIAARALDRVFVPLVAFDVQGHRLGTGGGFYDRYFAYLGRGQRWRRPRLFGVGYELQYVPVVPPERWDVALDAIVTDRRMLRPRRP
jgi:5-formyltetrahydrofolate cyclo-ligase